jgi:hypothetical protein
MAVLTSTEVQIPKTLQQPDINTIDAKTHKIEAKTQNILITDLPPTAR